MATQVAHTNQPQPPLLSKQSGGPPKGRYSLLWEVRLIQLVTSSQTVSITSGFTSHWINRQIKQLFNQKRISFILNFKGSVLWMQDAKTTRINFHNQNQNCYIFLYFRWIWCRKHFLKENNLIHKEFRQLFQIPRWRVWRTVSCIGEANKITHNIHQFIRHLLRTQVLGVVHPKI